MNLQKNITIPELLHLCETYGYSETLTALKAMHDKEKNVALKAVQSEKVAWLEGYISAGGFDGLEVDNSLPF
jgi:hypothetical protein